MRPSGPSSDFRAPSLPLFLGCPYYYYGVLRMGDHGRLPFASLTTVRGVRFGVEEGGVVEDSGSGLLSAFLSRERAPHTNKAEEEGGLKGTGGGRAGEPSCLSVVPPPRGIMKGSPSWRAASFEVAAEGGGSSLRRGGRERGEREERERERGERGRERGARGGEGHAGAAVGEGEGREGRGGEREREGERREGERGRERESCDGPSWWRLAAAAGAGSGSGGLCRRGAHAPHFGFTRRTCLALPRPRVRRACLGCRRASEARV